MNQLATATERTVDARAVHNRAATIPQWLDRLAQRATGNSVLVERRGKSADWESVTFTDLLARIRKYAAALSALGARKSEAIAVMLPTSLAWECIDKAILTMGGVVVGIEPHAPEAHRARVADTARPRVLIAETLEQVRAYPQERLADLRFAIVKNLEERTDVHGVIVYPWNVLDSVAITTTSIDPPTPHDPAAIVFTSGTTGATKGVVFSHAQLLWAKEAVVNQFGSLTTDDRTICWLPMANLFQRMLNLCAMECGMAVYYHANPRTLIDQLRVVRPTVLIGVPKFYQRLYRGFRERIQALPLGLGAQILGALDALALNSEPAARAGQASMLVRVARNRLRSTMGGRIKFMVSGSAPCSTEIVRFFHALNMPLLEAYGVSENVVPIALNTPDHGKIGTVGRPLSPKDVSFADDGEVLVRGWGISTGYLGLPAGEFTVDRDGWYHTGDLGQMDEDGYLVLIGRKADVAKLSNGRRVNLSSVEKSLWMMESVDEVVAFAHGRDYVTCAIVPSRIQSESPVHEEQLAAIAEVVADLQTDWPGFQKVRGLLVLPRPLSIEQEELTPNLKVRRRVIEQHHENKLGVLDALIRHDSSKNGESIPILHA